MPFFEGLESGVMRPVFLADGSLLLGQTGRGWQAKGGKVASLQHVRWDGKTVAPGDSRDERHAHRLPPGLHAARWAAASTPPSWSPRWRWKSWTYRDASDYGSPELALRDERVTAVVSTDRKSLNLALATLEQPQVHKNQTARVYHVRLRSQTLFDAAAPATMDAYYTLRRFPAAAPSRR
jgi:hypothetical protein